MLQDLRYAARLLLSSHSFSAVAVVSLAVAIGANSAMFSVVHAVLLNPLPYAEPDRLVAVREHAPGEPNSLENVAPANYMDWKARTRSFAGMVAYIDNYSTAYNLTGVKDPERVRGIITTGGFFALLGVTPVLGRELRDDEPVGRGVLLSHRFWLRKFGGASNVVGSQIALSGEPRTIIGVLPADFRFRRDVEIWPQFNPEPGSSLAGNRATRWWSVIARLRPGAAPDQAQAEMNTITTALAIEHPRENRGRGARVVPLHEDLSGRAAPPLSMLYAAVCLVLLIACANVAGLLLARLGTRHREMGVRVALGASRLRLARQLLAESLLLAVPAAAAGLLLATWLVDVIVMVAPADLPRLEEVTVSGRIVAFTTALSVLCAVLFGIVPMLQASRVEPSTSLREGRSVTSAAGRLRVALIIGQVALSLVLLVGAGLLLRSYERLSRVDPGFTPDRLVSVELALQAPQYFSDWNRVVAFYDRALSEVSAVPGVESAAAASLTPLGEGQFDERIAAADAPEVERRAEYRFVSPAYFSALRIGLIRGRDFSLADRPGSVSVAILGQSTAAQLFGTANPIGKQIILRGKTRREVVGIVGDTHLLSLGATPPLQVYIPFPQGDDVYWTGLHILMRSAGDLTDVARVARERLLTIDAGIPPYNARTLESLMARSLAPARMYAAVLTAFAVLAVVLACVGVYGLIASLVTQRSREFGIRLALGASAGGVATLVLREAVYLIGAGAALGTGMALAGAHTLTALLFDISPTDWRTFTGMTVLLILVGLIASGAPVRRAMRVDPVTVLRIE